MGCSCKLFVKPLKCGAECDNILLYQYTYDRESSFAKGLQREAAACVRFLKAALYPDKMKFTCEWSCRMRDGL